MIQIFQQGRIPSGDRARCLPHRRVHPPTHTRARARTHTHTHTHTATQSHAYIHTSNPPNTSCRAVGILSAFVWMFAVFYNFVQIIVVDKPGQCYESGECDAEPVNKLVACGSIGVLFL